MKMKQEIISKIKSSISIVEVIRGYVDLHKKGNNWFGCCPFHDEKTASFCVNESKRIFSCFSCQVHGDVFTFLVKINNISYSSAILKAAKFANLSNELINQLTRYNENESKLQYIYDINQLANKYFKMFIKNKENHHALEYLYKRGLNDEVINRFEVGFAPDDSDIMINLLTNKDNMVPGAKQYKFEELKNAGIITLLDNGEYISFFKNRIIFPIYNQHSQLVGFSGRAINGQEPKYLNTAQTPVFNKNEILYNFNEVVKNSNEYSIYLVEGFMDVIAMYRAGYSNTVATMGVAFSEHHLNQLKNIHDLSSVIMAFDNDHAGLLAMQKTAPLIANNYDVYMVNYLSDKYKDIDELLHGDKELCDQTINNIVFYYDYEIKNLLNNTFIKNIIDKEHLINKLVSLLNKYTNEEKLQTQIKLICKELDVDEKSLIKKLQQSDNKLNIKAPTKTYKKNNNTEAIELHANKKTKIKLVKYTEKTEIVIIECCLLSRDAWELFFQKAGSFLISENIEILNMIDNFYTKNLDKECISLNDVNDITKDSNYIAFLTNMIIEIEKRKIVYAQKKLLDTIDTHLKQIYKYYWDMNYSNAINAKDETEKQKYLDRLDRLIDTKRINTKKSDIKGSK